MAPREQTVTPFGCSICPRSLPSPSPIVRILAPLNHAVVATVRHEDMLSNSSKRCGIPFHWSPDKKSSDANRMAELTNARADTIPNELVLLLLLICHHRIKKNQSVVVVVAHDDTTSREGCDSARITEAATDRLHERTRRRVDDLQPVVVEIRDHTEAIWEEADAAGWLN